MKQLIDDYNKRIETLETELSHFKSTGSINDVKKVERLTTKKFEYKTFIAELERIQRDSEIDSSEIPEIGQTIYTVRDLKAFFTTLKDDDQLVMEAIDLETGDVQDLYPFHMDVIDGIELTDGRKVSEVRFCQESNVQSSECTSGLKIKKPYFKVISQGYNKGLEREEIQVHCGENGNLMIIKTPEGFIVDIYNQMKNVNSLTVWEDDLSPLEIKIDPVKHSEKIAEFLIKNGQKHSEITANLNLRPSHADSDEILMEDYFYLEGRKRWYPKSGNSMYGDFESAIALYLQENRDNY